MTNFNKVISNTTYYTLSTILLRASSLIFFPIFSLYLTKSDYGTFSVVQSIVMVVGLLGGLGLNRSLTRFVYYNSDLEENDHNTIIYTTLISNFFGQLFFILLFIFIGPIFLGPILKDIPFYPYVFIALITLPLNSLVETARFFFKAVHEGKKAFVLDMSFFSLNILFNLLFVVVLGYDVLGLFLGVLCNTILFSLILMFAFYSKYVFRFKSTVWRGMVKYSVPLLPFIFLNVVFESVDKLFLNANNGSSDSGIYYLALTFAAIFSSFKESVISALSPWVFENMKSSTTDIRRVFNFILFLTGVIGFLISLFAQEVLVLLSSNPEFIQAYKFVPFAVISFYIIFLGQLFNIKTLYFGNYHKFLFIATVLGIITEIGACYYLIPVFGITGAVTSRIIAFFVQTICFLYYSKKESEYRNIYNYQFLFSCLFFMSALISIPYFIELPFSFVTNLFLKIGILVVVSLILFFSVKNKLKNNLSFLIEIAPFIKKFIP